MEIRQKAGLYELYTPRRDIVEGPELRFIRRVCEGDREGALGCFLEKRLFTDAPVAVDAPWERYEGQSGLLRFIDGFADRFGAQSASVTPYFVTRANGHSVTEAVIGFVRDGMIDQVPMFLVGDLGTQDTLEELRIYCHAKFVPGLTPYRRPMFTPAHLEAGDGNLLTGAVKEYYEALHHMPNADVERIMRCTRDDCVFGGYEPHPANLHQSRETLRADYERMASYIPAKVAMRYETIIDDGVTCVIEWVHIISDAGRRDKNRPALSGIAAYERGSDGRLCSIRISDYAGYENEIDWTKTGISREEAYRINAVHEFPAGVGLRGQVD